MTPRFFCIAGEPVTLCVEFAVVQCLLQDDADWGAEVLRRGGYPAFYWQVASRSSRWSPSKIIPHTRNKFTAYGSGSKWLTLAYRIERTGEDCIRITSVPHLAAWGKILSAVILAFLGGWTVLLAPLVWDLLAMRNAYISRQLLPAFCRYLYDELESGRSRFDSSESARRTE